MTESGLHQGRTGSCPRSIGVTSLPILRSCARRVALSKFGSPSERLPSTHPFAILGTLYHDFLEMVGRGDAGNPAAAGAFPDLWEQCVQKVEQTLRGTPDMCWVPVGSTMADLERTRLRAFRAGGRVRVFERVRGAAAPGERRRGPELPVHHPVSEIELRGKIDLVTERDQVAQIVDYKTGTVLGEGGAVKHAYREQLQVYAGMLESTTGERVGELMLVDQNGEEHPVDVDWSHVQDVMKAAEKSLRDFASRWPATARCDRDILEAYRANPSDDICSRCDVRHRCDAHTGTMIQQGRVAMGRPGRDLESADLYGRVESATKCSLGWAVRLRSAAGRLHLRGSMDKEPTKGAALQAYGVVPGPANPLTLVDEITDFVVPRWGRVEIAADESNLPDLPARRVCSVLPGELQPSKRVICEGDVCLKVHGASHVDRITDDGSGWRSGRAVEAAGMNQSLLAFCAVVSELQRVLATEQEQGRLVWCATKEAGPWLQDVPPLSLGKLTGSEPWYEGFLALHEWWQKQREGGGVQVVVEKDRREFSKGPVTTVLRHGRGVLRVALPGRALPPAIAGASEGADCVVLARHAAARATQHARSGDVDETPVTVPEPRHVGWDAQLSVKVAGARGRGRIAIRMLSDRLIGLDMPSSIAADCSTVPVLNLLGLLEVAERVLEAELLGVRVRCSNDVAVQWLGGSKRPPNLGGHDAETRDRLEGLLAWWRGLVATDDYELDFIGMNPVEGVRPTVELHREQLVLFSVSA